MISTAHAHGVDVQLMWTEVRILIAALYVQSDGAIGISDDELVDMLTLLKQEANWLNKLITILNGSLGDARKRPWPTTGE